MLHKISPPKEQLKAFTTNINSKPFAPPEVLSNMLQHHYYKKMEYAGKSLMKAQIQHFTQTASLLRPEVVKKIMGMNLRRLSRGAHGVTYETTLDSADSLHRIAKKYESLLYRLRGPDKFLAGDDIIVKIITPIAEVEEGEKLSYNKWHEFIIDCANEAAIHDKIRRTPPLSFELAQGKTVVLNPSSHVPKLYYAGFDSCSGTYIIVMERIKGQTFNSDSVRASFKNIARLEKAMLTLHAIGIVHGDMHLENIMLRANPSTGEKDIIFIDFGMSIRIPNAYVVNTIHAIKEACAAMLMGRPWPENLVKDLWYGRNTKGGIGGYVNQIMKHQSFAWYNPNSKVLLHLLNTMNKSGQVAVSRAEIWGIRRPTAQRENNNRKQGTFKRKVSTSPQASGKRIKRNSSKNSYLKHLSDLL